MGVTLKEKLAFNPPINSMDGNLTNFKTSQYSFEEFESRVGQSLCKSLLLLRRTIMISVFSFKIKLLRTSSNYTAR